MQSVINGDNLNICVRTVLLDIYDKRLLLSYSLLFTLPSPWNAYVVEPFNNAHCNQKMCIFKDVV